MSDYYAVSVRVEFGVIASSEEEAEEMARELVPIDDVPARAIASTEVYLTPNQSDQIKRYAVNAE
jgi:hypothetical protein